MVADITGSLVSKTLLPPLGTTRHTLGTTPTDYAFTGQMQEGDIYFYNARWYDPLLGRFLQADTIVPPTQGTQGFDRFAYVNNNPLLYTDPSGQRACDDYYGSGCAVFSQPSSPRLIPRSRWKLWILIIRVVRFFSGRDENHLQLFWYSWGEDWNVWVCLMESIGLRRIWVGCFCKVSPSKDFHH